MEVKKAKKVIARPVQVNSSQTSSATTTTVRTAVGVTRPTLIGIKDVQRLYLPMLSLTKIRKIVTLHVHTIKVGNKFLVQKDQLEKLLSNPEIKIL